MSLLLTNLQHSPLSRRPLVDSSSVWRPGVSTVTLVRFGDGALTPVVRSFLVIDVIYPSGMCGERKVCSLPVKAVSEGQTDGVGRPAQDKRPL